MDVEEENPHDIVELMFKALNNDMSLFIVINSTDKLFKLDLTTEQVQNKLLGLSFQANPE